MLKTHDNTFRAFLPPPPHSPLPNTSPHSAAYAKGAKRLFTEALNLYLRAITQQHMLSRQDKRLLLLAVHGLTQLNNYPLARVLIRLSFSDLTVNEMLEWTEQARQTQHDLDCPY